MKYRPYPRARTVWMIWEIENLCSLQLEPRIRQSNQTDSFLFDSLDYDFSIVTAISNEHDTPITDELADPVLRALNFFFPNSSKQINDNNSFISSFTNDRKERREKRSQPKHWDIKYGRNQWKRQSKSSRPARVIKYPDIYSKRSCQKNVSSLARWLEILSDSQSCCL